MKLHNAVWRFYVANKKMASKQLETGIQQEPKSKTIRESVAKFLYLDTFLTLDKTH